MGTSTTAKTKPSRTSTTTAKAPSKTASKTAPKAGTKPKSRAVIRDVEAGSSVDCAHCGERVKFQAKLRNRQVICNVYINGVWNRVEHFHAECYEVARQPHGPIEGPLDTRRSPGPTRTPPPSD